MTDVFEQMVEQSPAEGYVNNKKKGEV